MDARDPSGNVRNMQLDPAGNLKILAVPGEGSIAANIANGQSLSAQVDLGTGRLARIVMPGGWDAADITFQVSHDAGATWSDLYDSLAAEYAVKAAAGRAILLPLADFLGVRYLKIRSGKAGAAVNQTAARALTLALV